MTVSPAPTTNSIEVLDLAKLYPPAKKFLRRGPAPPPVEALAGIRFDVGQGELVAFLGPNGAGKSTTIKILSGILTPSRGSARLNGEPAGSRAAARQLGMVMGTRSQLYMHMRVEQSLDLVAEIYGVTGALKIRRIGELAERFSIGRYLPQRARSLSLGERMRCELVAALIHEPRILLADEPTIGLDVVAKNQLRRLVKEWQAASHTTLLLTSHDLADVEALCDRCILIDQGKILFDGDMTAVKGELAWKRRFTVTVKDADVVPFAGSREIAALTDQLGNPGQVDAGARFVHRYESDVRRLPMHEAVKQVMAHYGESLQDVRIEDVSLEEVLHRLYATRRVPP